MKRFVKITLISLGISIFYIALSSVLAMTENVLRISLRTWADVLGKTMAALVTPLLAVVTLVVWFHKRERIHAVVRGVFTLAAGAGCLFWAYWTILFIALGVREERMIAPGLLVTNEAAFLGPSEYSYCRPVAVFFKTPAELTDEIKIDYLERKYDRKFMTDVSENGLLCDREFPDVKVSVYLESMALNDDYVRQTALKYLTEGHQALGIRRGYHITKNRSGRDALFYLEFGGEADIEALAGDLSRLLCYCTEQTGLFDAYYGNIGVSCSEGAHEIAFTLPFGKLQLLDKGDRYFRSPDRVAEMVAEKYADYADQYARMDARAQQAEKTEPESREELVVPIEQQADSVEEDARALYEAVFAEQGFSYHADYNAKGNFYAGLGEKEGYFYALVYDRTSENGACELYVLYKFTEDSTDQYVIVDMYAVETATKRVAASGRKRWSDVGTEEYREMTEKK